MPSVLHIDVCCVGLCYCKLKQIHWLESINIVFSLFAVERKKEKIMKYNNNNNINRCKYSVVLKRLDFKWPLEESVLLFPCCRVQFFFQGKCIPAMTLNTYYLFKIFVLSTEFHFCKFQSGHLYCGFILMKNWVDVQ